MKIEDAIENLEITIMVEETKHDMRDADGELEHGETKRHLEQVESLKMGISALEKQIPKEPVVKPYGYFCAVCDNPVGIDGEEHYRQKYCEDCGQAQKWGDNV